MSLTAQGWAAALCSRLAYLDGDTSDALCLMARIAMPANRPSHSSLLAYDLGLRLGRIERLLRRLTRRGLVVVDRGRGGGARLSRAAELISLHEIVEAVCEGPSVAVECQLQREFNGLVTQWLGTHHLGHLSGALSHRRASLAA
jgi:DNA-binding IscR family transcriptional regulator